MRGFGSLLWKEWRDIRAVYLGAFVFAATAIWVLAELAMQWKNPRGVGEILVPLATLLAAAIVAADVISGDVKSRRMESLALLPVPRRRVLASKLLFVVQAVALFAVALTLWSALLFALFARDGWEGPFLDGLWAGRVPFAFVGAITAAVVFFSALSFRSFVAALLGMALPVALFLLGGWFRLHDVLDLGGSIETIGWCAGVLAVLFVVAASAAFLRGPAHVASGRRLAAVGFSALAVIAIPPLGGVAWAVHDFYAVVPGSPDVELDGLHVSPDETLVALTAHRDVDWKRKTTRAHDTWVFDLATGEHVLDEGPIVGCAGWTPRGELWLWRRSKLPGFQSEDDRGWIADPRTGDRIRVPEAGEARNGLLDSMLRRPSWGAMASTNRAPGSRYVIAPSDGSSFDEALFHGYPCLLEEPGQVAAVTEAGALELRDLIAGTSRVLIEKNAEYAGPWSASPSQRYLTARVDGHPVVVELATGRIVLEEPSVRGVFQWARSATRRDVLVAHSARSGEDEHEAVVRLIDFDRDLTIDLPPELRGHSFFAVRPLSDGRFVMIAKGKRLVLLAADGTLERELYAPRATD